MLPKRNRISRLLFKKIGGRKEVFHSTHFSLVVVNNNLEEARFACVISSKAIKLAVLRNKVRRFVYASFLEHLEFIKKKRLYVLHVKKNTKEINREQVEKEIFLLLKKSKSI